MASPARRSALSLKAGLSGVVYDGADGSAHASITPPVAIRATRRFLALITRSSPGAVAASPLFLCAFQVHELMAVE